MNNNQGRKRVRRAQKKSQISRILLMIGMMALVAVISIGGTIAWLTDKSTEVKNTFEASGIDIALTETQLNEDGTYAENPAEDVDNKYKVIPGKEYKKDPTVSVDAAVTDVDIYLFVQFDEVDNPATYYDYTSLLNEDNGWKLVDNETNVWYRTVKVDDGVKSWNLLKDDKIVVKSTVTKGDMTKAAAAQLVYKAYAIQVLGYEDNVAGAWATASTATN